MQLFSSMKRHIYKQKVQNYLPPEVTGQYTVVHMQHSRSKHPIKVIINIVNIQKNKKVSIVNHYLQLLIRLL